MARYGQNFKDRAVARLLPPESAAVESVARDLSISVSTLERWRAWTAAARFEAVLASAMLDEANKNAWCREYGIYPQQLEQWRHQAGARLRPACQTAGITVRTLQRWRSHGGLLVGDKRPTAERATPSHALSEEARAQILARVNEPRFAELPPARIVPMLADEGVYLASESSFQRILRAHGQTAHRGRSRAPQPSRRPGTHIATSPGQVWCRDMTYLPTQVQGHWFYLYLIMDLYSRKIVGWEVHPRDDADHAVHLLKRTALAEGIHASVERPVLHGDNGSTLKATTALAMLNWLRYTRTAPLRG
ncbi:hypothetical protein AGMMS49545_22120 [Betaproteobacteria bacterium]|nr:hypothetical protein AGMMS49545_22120 [Betaproteobacteria bacterium]GHU42433.1 hypothetical protein AGMMS50289_07140 [Betaproteobacteria bacterium]